MAPDHPPAADGNQQPQWWHAPAPTRPPAPGEVPPPPSWPPPPSQWRSPQQPQWGPPQQQWQPPNQWGQPQWGQQYPGQTQWGQPAWPPSPTPIAKPRTRSTGMAVFAIVVALAALFLGATGLSRVLDAASSPTSSGRQLDRSYDRSITRVPGASNPSNAPAPAQGWNAVAASVNPGIVDIQTQLTGGTGFGTGIILTADGRIVTNHHVIDGARRIVVTTVVDGQQYRARVVASDPDHDVAVLQMQGASGLTPAVIGDSSAVSAGDAVAAIGNAGGLGGIPTVSPGNVLGTDRSIVASETYGAAGSSAQKLVGMIEIVADVQPGDSGGAVVDTQGRVIGMTTAASAAEDASPNSEPRGGGLGYAIPMARVLDIVDQLVN